MREAELNMELNTCRHIIRGVSSDRLFTIFVYKHKPKLKSEKNKMHDHV